MLRVSESTSSFSELRLLKPRALTAQALAVCSPTWMPGTSRSASGMLVAPERRMVSRVTTATAAAASRNDSSVRDTDVISTFMSSSGLMRFNWSRGTAPALFAAHGNATNTPSRAVRAFTKRFASHGRIDAAILHLRPGGAYRVSPMKRRRACQIRPTHAMIVTRESFSHGSRPVVVLGTGGDCAYLRHGTLHVLPGDGAAPGGRRGARCRRTGRAARGRGRHGHPPDRRRGPHGR